MADALRTQQFDGFTNFLRPANLACVHQSVQTYLSGPVVGGAEFLCLNAQLIAADAEGHDGFRVAALCAFHDFLRSVRAKLPSGIEYPLESEPAALERLGGAEYGFEICFRPLFSQKHHTDGQGYFRIDHPLREQVLGEVARDERIVLRFAQERSDPLEGLNEFGKVGAGVALANFLLGHDETVTSRQQADGGRLDGAFQMEVQLRFGQRELDNALLDFGGDFRRVDARVELKYAPEVFRTRLAMDERAFDCRERTPPDDRQLIVLHRNVEPFPVYTRHLHFEQITVAVLHHARRRHDELVGALLNAVAIFAH